MPAYSPAQVAKRLHIASSSVRNYCSDPRLAPFLSAGATPPRNQARELCDQDVNVLAFVSEQTRRGVTLATIAERLSAGEVPTSSANGHQEPPQTAQEPLQPAVTALAQVLSTELQTLRQDRDALWERVVAAESRAAQLEGELVALRAQRRPGLLARLFGR